MRARNTARANSSAGSYWSVVEPKSNAPQASVSQSANRASPSRCKNTFWKRPRCSNVRSRRCSFNTRVRSPKDSLPALCKAQSRASCSGALRPGTSVFAVVVLSSPLESSLSSLGGSVQVLLLSDPPSDPCTDPRTDPCTDPCTDPPWRCGVGQSDPCRCARPRDCDFTTRADIGDARGWGRAGVGVGTDADAAAFSLVTT